MFRPLLISLFLTSTALATTWTVDDDGKADFDNIQAAVDAASDGDEIIVMPGTYTSTAGEVVDMLGKAVWLHSSKGEEVITIIDGEGTRRGIYCYNNETSNTIIEGFTITNGYSNGEGGGMYNTNASSPTLTDCTFTGNTAFIGGGMCNKYDSSPTLTNCTFTYNTTVDGGGGMYNYSWSIPHLIDCIFENNIANGEGGGMRNVFSSPTLTNCTFTGNSATYGGGMGNYNYCSPTLTNCIFTGNTAAFGGGMWNYNSSDPTLTNCTFTNNNATSHGGGMYDYTRFNNNTTLTDTTVCGNTPDQIYGGWIDNGGNTVTDECPECPDINGDGYVNVSDLLNIIDQWGLTNSPADVNNDGIVDVTDLLIVVGNWGPCE